MLPEFLTKQREKALQGVRIFCEIIARRELRRRRENFKPPLLAWNLDPAAWLYGADS